MFVALGGILQSKGSNVDKLLAVVSKLVGVVQKQEQIRLESVERGEKLARRLASILRGQESTSMEEFRG
jgi:hypothetical protein